jgi:hypothetical protein
MFFSFDYCHILKNIRNNLMNDERKMTFNSKPINGKFLRSLYESQQCSTAKTVRIQTRKMLSPSSPEKMNVGRAVKLFSCDGVAALK